MKDLKNPERKTSALAALNRMDNLISETDAFYKIIDMYNDPKIEKLFLSSILRTCGKKGEKVLINEARNSDNINIRISCCSVMHYREPKVPYYLDIRLDKNDTHSITKILPGFLYTYEGKTTPSVFETEPNPNDHLEISSRDLLAALQRMVSNNNTYNLHRNPKIVHIGHPNIIDQIDFIKLVENTKISKKIAHYFIYYYEEPYQSYQKSKSENFHSDGKKFISEEIIQTLNYCLKDRNESIRLSAITTLGRIGVPESLLALDGILKCVKDPDIDIASKALWTMSKICFSCQNNIIPPINECLKSKYWKVKIASMQAIGRIGERACKQSLPILTKLFETTAINKDMVSDTIIKLGIEGENYLINIIRTDPDSKYKTKSIILRSFALANINSSQIDYIVELLYNATQSVEAIIRKSALYSLRVLRTKSNDKVSYLKARNLLPFYYNFLKDPDCEIKNVRHTK